jgi:hypothetical protein
VQKLSDRERNLPQAGNEEAGQSISSAESGHSLNAIRMTRVGFFACTARQVGPVPRDYMRTVGTSESEAGRFMQKVRVLSGWACLVVALFQNDDAAPDEHGQNKNACCGLG